MVNNQAIGIFDSGIGGLSVWKEINQLMPGESTIYIADSINAPYGEKSKNEIVDLCFKNTRHLLKNNCKVIVVACNTATTNAISILRQKFDVPFIGIEPATKPAAINTKTGKIGILATKGTLASELFLTTSKKIKGNVEIIETIGTGLVSVIESGKIEKAKPLLEKYLLPMISKGVDHIVLGCTHYPFLIPVINQIIPQEIKIIDSGLPVAKRVFEVINSENLLSISEKQAHHKFFTTGNKEILNQFLKRMCKDNYQISRLNEF